jgi:hypothetical protein
MTFRTAAIDGRKMSLWVSRVISCMRRPCPLFPNSLPNRCGAANGRNGPISDLVGGARSGRPRACTVAWDAHHFLDELSESACFSGRCSSGREHGPETNPGQFPIL